jgi:hypothetical protein
MRLPVAVVLSLSIAGLLGATKGVAAAAGSLPSARAFASAQTLDGNVLQLALAAASCARRTGAAVNDRLLTVIDYTKASTEPRLWVLDLESERVLFEEVVAHGRGSGENFATQFSNEEGSYQTSLGLFRTADTYVGANGYSLRLDGLESGVNDRARERAIVIHGAPYVNPAATRTLGRLGRSLGCPALRPAVARTLIDTIKEGSLVFSYYPDREWLRDSRFLNGCSS